MTIQESIKAAQSTRKKNDTYGKESSQGSDVARQSVSAQPSSTAASSAVPKLDLYGMALDALRSGTLPATTQFGRVNLPTGAAAFRANQRQETAQALDDRKREELEAERYRLTQPGRVYNEEVTAQNRARVQEIDRELSTLRPSGKYNPLMSVAGAVQKGLGQVAQGGGDALAFAEDAVYAPFELISGLKLGDLSDDGFFNRWAADIRRENEGVDQFYQRNMELGGKPAELFEGLGASAVAAAPNAALALATAGGSLAGQTSAGLAAAASSAWNPSVTATVQNTVSSMAKNPMFWTSFSQVVGNGYEKAIADQRTRGETDENLIRTKAALFAIGNGLLNAAVEVGGGIETLPSQLRGGESIWKSWVDSMVDEGKEEVVQGVIERALQNPIYQQENPLFSMSDSNAILNPYTAAQEFAGGAIVGGLLGGGQIALHRLAMANQQGASALDRPESSVSAAGGYYAGQADAAADLSAPTAAASSATVQSLSTLQTQKNAPTREAGTGLVPLTEQDEVRLSTGKNNIIARTFQDIVSFVKRARSKKGGPERLYMGTIPDSAAELIRSETGINVFGYTAILPGDSVQHIFKNHGTASTENSRGQRAVTENDIALIPEVLSSPDRVFLSQDTDVLGRSVLLLEKQIGDTYVTAQAVTDGRHALTTNSLWIQKKKNRPTIPDAGMTPSPEGNARSALSQGSSGPIISEGGQEVNPSGGAQSQTDVLLSTLGENGQKAFRAYYRSGSDLPSSFREFSKAYNQGLNGAKESAVEQGRYINTQAAYYAGQNDAAVSLAREKRAAQFAPTAGEESGLVYDDYVERTLDADTADKVNSVAKLLGVRVQFVDSVREGTANTQISGSDVLVEKDNPNPVMFLLGHEWTHRLQKTAPVEYRKFRDLVSGEVSEEAAVLLEQYRRAGETISYEAALDEAAANYAGRMIEDGSVLDNFIQRNREDRTLLEKIRDAIRTLISKLTGAEKRRAQTAEGKLNSALDAAAKNIKKSDGENTKSPDAQTGDASTGTNMIEAYNGKSLSEDREIYNYEFLSELPDMKITELPEISSVKGTDGKVSTRKVVEEGIKNARAVGVERDGKVYVKNGYTKREILISPGAIRHGLNGKLSRLLTNARLGSVIGNIVKNAVPINALQNKAGGVSGTYAMASYATDSQGREFVAIVTVEQRGGDISGIEVYDVTHAVSGRQKNASRADTKSQGVSPSTTGTISIKDLLNIVNTTHQSILSEDVLEHFGEARPSNGYYSQQAKFSLKGTEDAKSIAKMREENNLLRERVDDWKGQTRQTGQATTDKKAVARAARDLWAAYAGNKLPLDTKKEEPTCYDVRCQRFHRPRT